MNEISSPPKNIEVIQATFAKDLTQAGEPIDLVPDATFRKSDAQIAFTIKMKYQKLPSSLSMKIYQDDRLFSEQFDRSLSPSNDHIKSSHIIFPLENLVLTSSYRLEVWCDEQLIGTYPFKLVPESEHAKILDVETFFETSAGKRKATTSFPPNIRSIKVHVSVNPEILPVQPKLVWTLIRTKKDLQRHILGEWKNALPLQTSGFEGNIDLAKDWPAGDYKVDIYLDNVREATQPFSVLESTEFITVCDPNCRLTPKNISDAERPLVNRVLFAKDLICDGIPQDLVTNRIFSQSDPRICMYFGFADKVPSQPITFRIYKDQILVLDDLLDFTSASEPLTENGFNIFIETASAEASTSYRAEILANGQMIGLYRFQILPRRPTDPVIDITTFTKDNQGQRLYQGKFAPSDHRIEVRVELKPETLAKHARVVWTQINSPEGRMNRLLGEDTFEIPGNPFVSYFQHNQDWPVGDYKIDLFLDDQLTSTKTFYIRALSPQRSQVVPRTGPFWKERSLK